jgi:hypothetical protein
VRAGRRDCEVFAGGVDDKNRHAVYFEFGHASLALQIYRRQSSNPSSHLVLTKPSAARAVGSRRKST